MADVGEKQRNFGFREVWWYCNVSCGATLAVRPRVINSPAITLAVNRHQRTKNVVTHVSVSADCKMSRAELSGFVDGDFGPYHQFRVSVHLPPALQLSDIDPADKYRILYFCIHMLMQRNDRLFPGIHVRHRSVALVPVLESHDVEVLVVALVIGIHNCIRLPKTDRSNPIEKTSAFQMRREIGKCRLEPVYRFVEFEIEASEHVKIGKAWLGRQAVHLVT